jgi:UDP-galactopyranose mutase
VGGYTKLFEALLKDSEVRLGVDFLADRSELQELARCVIYTGAIDEYFDYRLGALEYRSLRFETSVQETANFQGNAVVNYTDAETPYTRVIEHKHFALDASLTLPRTVVTQEYPAPWQRGQEAYYPVNDTANQALLARYQELAKSEVSVRFCGRLGEYKYLNMDNCVEAALGMAERELL